MTKEQSRIVLKKLINFQFLKKSTTLLFIQLFTQLISFFRLFSLKDKRFLKFLQMITALCSFDSRKCIRYFARVFLKQYFYKICFKNLYNFYRVK